MSAIFPDSTSIPKKGFLAFSEYNLAMISSALSPAFSARVLGMHSKACPNLSTAYWSSPGLFLAKV